MIHTDSSDADEFKGRTALVSGAGGGVGRACALYLAGRGATLLMIDPVRDDAERTAGECESLGATAVVLGAPSLHAEGAARLVEAGREHCEALDTLVVANESGIPGRALATTPEDDVRSVLGNELLWTIWLVRAVLPHLSRARDGRIVTLASGVGTFGLSEAAISGASRAGIVGFTKSLARELDGSETKVNAIAPIVAGGSSEALFRTEPRVDPERYRPALVAPVMAYLCHPSCELNGEVISAGGGRVARVLSSVSVGHLSTDLSVAQIAADLPRILSPEHALTPRDAADELLLLEI